MSLQKLTNEQFWDDHWGRRRAPRRPLSPRHLNFGRRGLFMRLLTTRLGELAGKRVLELGGGGINYRLLAMRKWMRVHVSAVDFSDVAVRQLQELFRDHGEPVDAVHADVFDWHPDCRFDVVVHWGVVEHFSDPAAILQVSQRCLTPRGRLLFSMPNLHASSTALWRRWSPDDWTTHICHETETIRAACDQTNLRLDGAFYFGVPSLQVPRWECTGWLPAMATWLQRGAKASAALVPCYHAIGGKCWSMHRGFVATNFAV